MGRVLWVAVGLFIWFFAFLQIKGVRFQELTSADIWDFVGATVIIPIILILFSFFGIIFKNSFKGFSRQYDRTRGDYYDRDGGDGGGG